MLIVQPSSTFKCESCGGSFFSLTLIPFCFNNFIDLLIISQLSQPNTKCKHFTLYRTSACRSSNIRSSRENCWQPWKIVQRFLYNSTWIILLLYKSYVSFMVVHFSLVMVARRREYCFHFHRLFVQKQFLEFYKINELVSFSGGSTTISRSFNNNKNKMNSLY